MVAEVDAALEHELVQRHPVLNPEQKVEEVLVLGGVETAIHHEKRENESIPSVAARVVKQHQHSLLPLHKLHVPTS